MFLVKGGHKVKRGTYWDLEHDKIILNEDGYLPGTDKDRYFKLPESYLLIIMLLLGLALSMALPYGMDAIVFFCLIALSAAIYRGVCVFQTLPKEVIIVIIEKSTETMFLSELDISSKMAAALIISRNFSAADPHSYVKLHITVIELSR